MVGENGEAPLTERKVGHFSTLPQQEQNITLAIHVPTQTTSFILKNKAGFSKSMAVLTILGASNGVAKRDHCAVYDGLDNTGLQ